jgi:hypothetical protein
VEEPSASDGAESSGRDVSDKGSGVEAAGSTDTEGSAVGDQKHHHLGAEGTVPAVPSNLRPSTDEDLDYYEYEMQRDVLFSRRKYHPIQF